MGSNGSSRSPFEKYVWVTQVRGICSTERAVLWFLTSEANASGHIEKLYQRNIGNACELQRRQLLTVLDSLQSKRFLVERIARKGSNGIQISSGYRLDLARNHPTDDNARHGAVLLKLAADTAEMPDHSLEGADAYYNLRRRVLTLWLETERAAQWFADRRAVLQSTAASWSPRLKVDAPLAFEFIHPKGALSTPAPRDRGRRSR